MQNSSTHQKQAAFTLPYSFSIGFAAVVLFFLISGALSYVNLQTIIRDSYLTTQTHDTLIRLEKLLSFMKDAETGQRGYLITGDERYLDPYKIALSQIQGQLEELSNIVEDSSFKDEQLKNIRASLSAKLEELETTLEVRRTRGFDAARELVETGRGKESMDRLRRQIQSIQDTERQLRITRATEMQSAFRITLLSGAFATLTGVILSSIVGFLIRRAVLIQRRQSWIQTGLVGLSSVLAGDQRPEQIGENTLKFLTDYLRAYAGAFFIRNGNGFDRVATYGVPTQSEIPLRIEAGEGLLWQAAKDNRTFLLTNVPEGYLTVGSGLGTGNPSEILVTPVTFEGQPIALLEIGSLSSLPPLSQELLATSVELIGRAVKAATYRVHLQNLLDETQRQSERLQVQGEELRVSNEELEEQSHALKESQSRLEQQQVELEQSNAQLEEQTQLLETQKDDLVQAQAALEIKARELEQASQYKSDFLANMSHELRTPLNSSLILAKLLADNTSGNLSAEQITYARTIESSGNDLLNLINDILDLSKIEAGRMDITPAPVRVTDLLLGLSRIFEPIANEKKLSFAAKAVESAPVVIHTDQQRLEQILKNLLSNAFKFTEHGSVNLAVSGGKEGSVVFVIRDTGIGIAPDKREVIFEAFRQADGTTNRKYGGTGLGLSISRELSRLLGGDIRVESTPGQGSVFSVTLPCTYDPASVSDRVSMAAQPLRSNMSGDFVSPPLPQTPPRRLTPRPVSIEDDRSRLQQNAHVILVVEDDESFARILYDLAHELKFQCLVAGTAEEALAMAKQYLPSAIVLDVGLPDDSGLSVLDRLKHDSRTRHIPVHVVSAGDYSQTALSLGAVGYMLKPVRREQLLQALGGLEQRLSHHIRRVLVVEDDAVQLDSLCALLSSHAVETIGARTASECLERLKNETFDCMVLDLSLPDTSGYTLLETLSREDAYSFPPVIVYTGKELPAEEEQKLRRYSKSIIIKGAKSPERLLDEVTLFLHQVVSELPAEQQRMLEVARSRDAVLEGRRILVVEDDVRNVFALSSLLEPRGATVQIARNGLEALQALEAAKDDPSKKIDLVLMDVMMPEMDGLTATREIRKRQEWRNLPIIVLTAKAMPDDQERCIRAGANDYMSKPLSVEKLLSLVRVWMPR